MKVWPAMAQALETHGRCAMVSILAVEGSSPREAGARLVVTPAGFHGTIGGGALEWRALAIAQAMLEGPPAARTTNHALGPELGQCCGGRVTLLTETFASESLAEVRRLAVLEEAGPFRCMSRIAGSRVKRRIDVAGMHRSEFEEKFGDSLRTLYLFGAGHVGRALVLALAPLPFAVRWVDPRPAAFPGAVPSNVTQIHSADPPAELHGAPDASFALVMTHSHALDLAIVDAALRNERIAFTGLIGSASKRARFEHRLRAAGVAPPRLAGLVCPIGVAGIDGKAPAVIAASAVAQILIRDEMLKTQDSPDSEQPIPAKVAAGRRG